MFNLYICIFLFSCISNLLHLNITKCLMIQFYIFPNLCSTSITSPFWAVLLVTWPPEVILTPPTPLNACTDGYDEPVSNIYATCKKRSGRFLKRNKFWRRCLWIQDRSLWTVLKSVYTPACYEQMLGMGMMGMQYRRPEPDASSMFISYPQVS